MNEELLEKINDGNTAAYTDGSFYDETETISLEETKEDAFLPIEDDQYDKYFDATRAYLNELGKVTDLNHSAKENQDIDKKKNPRD